MNKKNGIGKFIFGACLGAGLGILFAPKKGSQTRKELKNKFDELANQIKEIDLDEIKAQFDEKIEAIKDELRDLDKEKALSIAKKKSAELKVKSQELVDLAVDKGTPMLKDTANDIKDKVVSVSKDVIKKLEKGKKNE